MNLIKRIIERLVGNRDDYLSWIDIPRGYSFVAVDAIDSRDTSGRVVFQAGRPVAYSDPVHFVGGRWIFRAAKPGDTPKLAPKYVSAEVIIGPIPSPADSLRHRPGRRA